MPGYYRVPARGPREIPVSWNRLVSSRVSCPYLSGWPSGPATCKHYLCYHHICVASGFSDVESPVADIWRQTEWSISRQ